MSLKLGVPSKGRLMDKTFQWFSARNIILKRIGADREYAGIVEGITGIDLVLLSASEISRELAAGRIHLGVTGSDLVRESIADWQDKIRNVTPMGFGHADLILAVPKFWIDVQTLDDLDAVAAAFRKKHGMRLRIATKYHRLVREFLRDRGIADYQLVDSQGATEGTIKNKTAEMVADITSTGETLRANHLRILQDSIIHRSQATLFRSLVCKWDKEEQAVFETLQERLGLI